MHKGKVLLVEDDETLLNLTSILLRNHEYDVDVAGNGEVALEKLKHHPDIILLDRTLPDIDGLEVCRKIREDKRFRGIPVVMISGKDRSADRIEGLYVGADDYITKPFDSGELIARLDAILRRMHFSTQVREDKEKYICALKEIIDHQQIKSFFQPIFSLKTFEAIGFEALGRPPADGPLSNPEFLFRVAMSTGMYFDLEMLSWAKAFEQWTKLQKTQKLFLNCSPYLIECGRFSKNLFVDQGINASAAVLELTERIAIQDYSLFLGKLNEVRELDIEIAVDDVGCGYASLNTVAEVKPNFLKIDMPLIRSINKDTLKQDIVSAIVQFSKRSSMITIAEGIEKREELQKVIELGVDAGQGYLLAKPNQEFIMTPEVKL